MGNAGNKSCCFTLWKRSEDHYADESSWHPMQRDLMQTSGLPCNLPVPGSCSSQDSLLGSGDLVGDWKVMAATRQQDAGTTSAGRARMDDELERHTGMEGSSGENEGGVDKEVLGQLTEMEECLNSEEDCSSDESEDLKGRKNWMDDEADRNSRWHLTQRGQMRTIDLLGDHLVTEWREALRAAKETSALDNCALDLIRSLRSYEHESRALIKLADTGRVVQVFQRAIATLSDLLELRGSIKVEIWQQRLQQEREQRMQLYHELLDDDDRLRVELGDEKQQLEVQTLLKYGLSKYRDVLTPGGLDTMVLAFDASVRLSGFVVSTVPAWFATSELEWTDAKKSYTAGAEEACLRDVAVCATLQHPHVRKFYGACHIGEEPFVIHERCSQLDERMSSWTYFLGCARGILYVHERGLVHKDLSECHLLDLSDVVKGGLSGVGLVWSPITDESLRGGSCDHAASITVSQHPSRCNDVMRLGVIIFQNLLKSRLRHSGRTLPKTSEMKFLPDTKPNFVNDSEWHLLQGMCTVNHGERITMLDIVYQMAALADRKKSPSCLKDQIVRLKTVDDLRRYAIPSLNETIEEVFAKAVYLCDDEALVDLHRPVLKRLDDIYHQLLAWSIPPRLRLVETFVLILERWYCSLEHKMSLSCSYSQSSVGSICASRTIAGRNYSLHYDIDRLLRDYAAEGVDSSAAVHDWQPSWREVCQRQRQTLQTLVENPLLVLEGIENETDRSETLALLQSEAQDAGMHGERALLHLPLWFIPPHRVQLGQHIADGSFGAVYEGIYLDSSVVVKQVLTSGFGVEERRQFLQEVNLWFSLNHKNLVKLYGACHEGQPFFVCERAMGGTIVEYAKTQRDPTVVWCMLMDAAQGLQHLHDHGIVHGDLKGNNILVGRYGQDVKLADFGLSFAANQTGSSSPADDGALGAFRWKAPEVLQGSKPTFASDIYSFGMCIIETMSGKFPWGNSMSDVAVKHNVVQRRLLPQRPEGFDDGQWRVVLRMCCYNPKERVAAGALVEIMSWC